MVQDSTVAAVEVDALWESMLLEGGLGEVVEAWETGAAGDDSVLASLAVMKALAADVHRELVAAAADTGTPVSADEWEQVVGEAHTVLNQVGAVRAKAVAQVARWGRTDRDVWAHVQHPLGHRDEGVADELGPLLGLGPYEADRLVDESVWMASRTPALLDDAAAGAANLATVAAVATELQDARPETCELVEQSIADRGVHRRASRVAAGRSTRTLVEGFEAAAARSSAKRTRAEQTGVWLDLHPTPGLALLSATLPAADAEALMTAVDEHANRTHRESGDGRLLGEHRASALTDLALRNVTLTAHLEVITTAPTGSSGQDDRAGSAAASPRSKRAPQAALHVLRDAPIALTGRVGAVDGSALATVLAAHTRGRTDTTTTTLTAELAPGAAVQTNPPTSSTATGGYRPPRSLREAMIHRDRHCRFPGCTRPARYTDLDHVRPWPNGPTTLTNLQCVCRRHHRAKHRRWSVTMDPAGVCTWTSPSGRRYVTLPGHTTDLHDLHEIDPFRRSGD